MSIRSKKSVTRPFLLCGLFVGVSLLGAGCGVENIDSEGSHLDQNTDSLNAPTAGGSGCAELLNLDCNPAGKQYTQSQIAECKAQAEQRYDSCVVIASCEAARAPQEQACYPKPPEGSAARAIFDACIDAASVKFNACVGDAGGTGTGPG